MLTMLFVPLKVACVVGAVGSTSYRTGGKLFRWTFLYSVLSSLSAALVGVVMALVLKPGRRSESTRPEKPTNHTAMFTLNVLLDIVR